MKKTKTGKCLAKQTKGITLIALVITIVVLLILAAVSITAVFGDNGLLQMAKEAADKTNEAVGKEQEDISQLKNLLENQLAGENGGVTPTPTPSTTPEGKPLVGTLLNKEASDTNQEVQDKNGNPVVIPAGFTIVPNGKNDVKYTDPTNPTVDDGIVITDKMDKEGNVTGNEFVWVPVENPAEMYGIISEDEDGTNNYAGKLYDFENISEETGKPANLNWKNREDNKTEQVDGITVDWIEWTYTTSYREPDTLSSYDDNATYKGILGVENITDFKTQLQNEFNYLVKSVNKYKGFYIGRYETGALSSEDKNVAPKVQKDQTAGDVNWYYQYIETKNISLKNTDKVQKSVTSSMIWGSQWDAVMNWFLKGTEEEKEYVTDSSQKGNYTGSIELTGYYQVKNIYDMAGNAYDWTIEASLTGGRVLRGGDYGYSGSDYPASNRDYSSPYNSSTYRGSRSTLIVNL